MADAQAGRAVGREVGSLELFFDLVFVFAVSQLSYHLLTHLDWRAAGQTGVLLVAVFGVWAYTSFEATSRDAVHAVRQAAQAQARPGSASRRTVARREAHQRAAYPRNRPRRSAGRRGHLFDY